MKNIQFLIILLSFSLLSSCSQNSLIEKNYSLELMHSLFPHPNNRHFSPNTFSEQNQNINENTINLYCLFTPPFIDKVNGIVQEKEPSKNAYFYLGHIKNQEDASVIRRMFSYEFRNHDNLDEKWNNFKKVVFIKDHLSSLPFRFNQIIEDIIRKLEEKEKYRTDLNNLNQKMVFYNNKTIDSLKKEEDFLILIRESIELIDKIHSSWPTHKDQEKLSSLKKEIELFQEFFKKYSVR